MQIFGWAFIARPRTPIFFSAPCFTAVWRLATRLVQKWFAPKNPLALIALFLALLCLFLKNISIEQPKRVGKNIKSSKTWSLRFLFSFVFLLHASLYVLFFGSGVILKYLCETRDVPDHWYPKDIKARAKIDEYLSWHHTNLRLGAAVTVHKLVRYLF